MKASLSPLLTLIPRTCEVDALENPPCGLASECLELEREKNLTLAALNITKEERISRFGVFDRSNVQQASVSWWLLFVGVRQVITFTFAKLTQAVFIDFFCLRSDWVLRLLGKFPTPHVNERERPRHPNSQHPPYPIPKDPLRRL